VSDVTRSEGSRVLALRGISKSFGAVQALRDVDFELGAGEVVGLVGDNGAGKSTLLKTIGGVHAPDEGEIHVDAEVRSQLTPMLAQRLGIEMIHQNLALIDTLDVAANIFLNRERTRRDPLGWLFHWLDNRGMYSESAKALAQFGISNAVLRRPVRQLSGGQRQMVAIARAVYWQPRIVMMDEPTAALAVAHAARVLELVRSLAQAGIGVVFVSHDVQHVLQVTDRVVVLRHGVKVAELETTRTSHQEIVMYITGHTERGQRVPETDAGLPREDRS
jgi:ABC-type sugar transport system ATPase subunit